MLIMNNRTTKTPTFLCLLDQSSEFPGVFSACCVPAGNQGHFLWLFPPGDIAGSPPLTHCCPAHCLAAGYQSRIIQIICYRFTSCGWFLLKTQLVPYYWHTAAQFTVWLLGTSLQLFRIFATGLLSVH